MMTKNNIVHLAEELNRDPRRSATPEHRERFSRRLGVMLIPKTRVSYDAVEKARLKEEYLTVARTHCKKCSVCGGNVILQVAGNFWQMRICCENYRDQPAHGNIAQDTRNRRFTDWHAGENNLRDAIAQWEEINREEGAY